MLTSLPTLVPSNLNGGFAMCKDMKLWCRNCHQKNLLLLLLSYNAAKRLELCMLRILDSTSTQNLLHLLEKSLETKPCYILMPCAVRNPNENLTAKLRSEGGLVKK
jgi:hypothetical protein